MAYQCISHSTDESNILPVGLTNVAVTAGQLVRRNSSGKWVLADSLDIATAAASRLDAEGIVMADAAANSYINPIKRGLFDGWSGLTIGSRVFLSTTAGAVTQTDPGENYVRQVVGRAVSATRVLFEIIDNADNDLGEVSADSIQIGNSSSYRTYSTANQKVIEARCDFDGDSGDERVAYLRGKLGGSSAQGEAVRAYMQVDGAATQCHGIHATGEITTGGSISGQVVGGRCTAATGSDLTLSTGTINALRLDSDLNSAITSMTEAWIDIRDLNGSNKFTNFFRMTDVSTSMYVTKSGASSTKGLKVVVNGDTKYVMLCD